ncbi:FAD-dependent monooxygenase [Amycolatopsis sp. lyj-84]|uniref:FAD-dependent monooxygenase n=1 Tax=Amycolatopsis sp. lyj-84 TaxID=2789284 RepID=UPI00397E1826
MTTRYSVTVVVLGAGPAGSVTAAVLAARGIDTLVVDPDEDTAGHGVLLGAPARHLLGELGLATSSKIEDLPVELCFGPGTRHDLPDVRYSVVEDLRLRKALRRHAASAGVAFLRGAAAVPVAVNGRFEVRVGEDVVDAAHVVAATGAKSLPGGVAHGLGTTCTRWFSGGTVRGKVVLRPLAPPSDDPRGKPRYAWLSPGEGGFTIGGMTLDATADPARLSAEAFEAIVEVEPGAAAGKAVGPVVSGPAYCGFSPASAVEDGVLRVGDAAGLVNPFTGEGLGHAMRSGMFASRAIAACVQDPAAAAREYVRLLGSSFVGYFETARHAARRYHLAWRVLEAGASSGNVFYSKGRRAILLSAEQSQPAATGSVILPSKEAAVLAPFLLAADEVAVHTVRREWPFLAAMFTVDGGGSEFRLRPAMLVYAGILAGGRGPRTREPVVAAAVDLAMLGALALLGPTPAPRDRRGVDWESATTVLAGDYLLGQASRLVAEAAPALSWALADWLGELAALRAADLTSAEPSGVAESLFEFPLRIGAALAGVADEEVRVLRAYGSAVGRLVAGVEDVLALRGERTRMDLTLEAMLAAKTSTLPALLRRPGLTIHDFDNPGFAAVSLDVAVRAGRRLLAETRAALSEVNGQTARLVLEAFAGSVAAPLLG